MMPNRYMSSGKSSMHHIARISRIANPINKKNDEWTQLIQLSDPIRAKEEEELYEEMTKGEKASWQCGFKAKRNSKNFKETLTKSINNYGIMTKFDATTRKGDAASDDNVPHIVRFDTHTLLVMPKNPIRRSRQRHRGFFYQRNRLSVCTGDPLRFK